MACDQSFCSDYMVLKPEELAFRDVVGLLLQSDIGKRKFIDCPEGTKQDWGRRWLIFVSIIVQRLLQSAAKPLSWLGSMVELWLNLLSSNPNVFVLFWSFLQGKVVVPDRLSASFLSISAIVDKRTELDKNIKHGDRRYYAALSMMASKASYENKAYIQTLVTDDWKMEFLGSFDFWNDYQQKETTQAFMFCDKNGDTELIVVAFRGTETFDADAWSTDFDISWYELHSMGRVHGGFMKALGLQRNKGWPKQIENAGGKSTPAYYGIREMIRNLLQKNDGARFIVTGHSLGAALAILFPAILALHEESWLLERLEGVYTFGQPRVGDEKFGEFVRQVLNQYTVPYYRYVYCNDIVPRLPYDDSTLMFKHFGTCIYFDSFYDGKVVSEEPNKNYFSPLSIIPKIINAVWELIRSFVIPYTNGPEYKEGGTLRAMRLIGLVIAGLPAHLPQDYVNATRLGSSDIYNSVSS